MLPQTEFIKDKGYEILYLTDEIDEFVLQMIRDYKEKEFKSVSAEDISSEESADMQTKIRQAEEENKELLDFIRNTLGDRVTDVKLSPRLKDSAVCLTTKGGISLEMEKVLNAMPQDQHIRAERILELNPDHPVMETLRSAFSAGEEKKDMVKTYADLLYNQALLISGLTVEDPATFAKESVP